MKALFTPDRIVKIAILGIGAVLLLIGLFHRPRQRLPNVCPIDGHVAEWTKRTGDSCEYGHFSFVEKTTHTWSGPCM